MSLDPILLMGGSGAIGHHTARALRAAHPDVPLLIGGRDLAKAQRAAEHMGGARGVLIDSAADDLGLGDRPVSGVVVFIWTTPLPDCVLRKSAACRTSAFPPAFSRSRRKLRRTCTGLTPRPLSSVTNGW